MLDQGDDVRSLKIKRSDLVADKIKQLIVIKGLKPGDYLPSEKELIDTFQCSRGTIRETLKSLETQGLIQRNTGPKGGNILRAVHYLEAMQLLNNYLYFQNVAPSQFYAVRMILEPVVAQSVVGLLKEEDFAQLESMIELQSRFKGGTAGRADCRRAELEFHDILAKLCPNPFLSFVSRFLIYIILHFIKIREIEITLSDDFAKRNLADHRLILAALRNEDPAEVHKLMTLHMEDVYKFILSMGLDINTAMYLSKGGMYWP